MPNSSRKVPPLLQTVLKSSLKKRSAFFSESPDAKRLCLLPQEAVETETVKKDEPVRELPQEVDEDKKVDEDKTIQNLEPVREKLEPVRDLLENGPCFTMELLSESITQLLKHAVIKQFEEIFGVGSSSFFGDDGLANGY